jgi:hypothetical protein
MHETFNEKQKEIWWSLKVMNTNLTTKKHLSFEPKMCGKLWSNGNSWWTKKCTWKLKPKIRKLSIKIKKHLKIENTNDDDVPWLELFPPFAFALP